VLIVVVFVLVLHGRFPIATPIRSRRSCRRQACIWSTCRGVTGFDLYGVDGKRKAIAIP